MSSYDDRYITALVEPDRVHRSVYTDPALFALEMERLWGQAWIYVGHDSQVPAPGDYYASAIGPQSVIMSRHRDGNVHVLFNRCAHKGAQLVGDSRGHVKAFRCCYHGWVFDTDGTVLTIPRDEGYEGTGLCKGNPLANVQRVPRTECYRGFVFASLAADGPDLRTWLGGAKASIDNLCDRSPEGEVEISSGPLRYLHDCNWKMFVENLNDAMHPMVVHASSSGTARQIARQAFKDVAPEDLPFEVQMLGPFTSDYKFFDQMGVTACAYGHSYMGGTLGMESSYSSVGPYEQGLIDAYGETRAREILATVRHNTVVYPSFTLKCAIQAIRVVRPLAVDRTVIESWVLRLKGAPEEITRRSITYCNLINSSANLVGPDDYEAYHRLQLGLQTDGNDWVSMHRYLGRESTTDDGDRRAVGTSDLSFRNQYRAWMHYMTGAAAP